MTKPEPRDWTVHSAHSEMTIEVVRDKGSGLIILSIPGCGESWFGMYADDCDFVLHQQTAAIGPVGKGSPGSGRRKGLAECTPSTLVGVTYKWSIVKATVCPCADPNTFSIFLIVEFYFFL